MPLNRIKSIGRRMLKWGLVAAVLATAPISLPLILFALCTEIAFIPSEWQFKRRMRSLGRAISRSELRRRIEGSPGTIIIDSPTIGWNITRVWWTEDNVLAIAPVQPPTEEDKKAPSYLDTWHAFYRWCAGRYLDPYSGEALLLGVWHSAHRAELIARERPEVQLVYCWSGGRYVDEAARLRNLEQS